MAEITQAQIETWILTQATGEFNYTKVLDGQVAPKLYPQLREIMLRCKKKGIAYPVSGKDGWWRPGDSSLEEIHWWDSNGVEENKLILPLGINKYCIVPRPSLVIVAGKYNAGKTCFCLNTTVLNIPNWPGTLDLYVSEGMEKLKSKFTELGVEGIPAFRTYRRTENFADIIQPDNLSIIDYLRVDMTQAYAVSEKLFEIFNKLKTGIAVVAMQKPPGERKLAFGGASTAFEPSLYIGMESNGANTGWVGFEKIKIPTGYGGWDWTSTKIYYRIEQGITFTDIEEKQEG